MLWKVWREPSAWRPEPSGPTSTRNLPGAASSTLTAKFSAALLMAGPSGGRPFLPHSLYTPVYVGANTRLGPLGLQGRRVEALGLQGRPHQDGVGRAPPGS